MLELQKFNYLNIRLPGVLCYKINDFRRPWLNYVINRLRKNKIVNIYNSSGLFNNVIDTFEIFRLNNYLGKKNIGRISKGLKANLVLLDNEFNLIEIYLNGKKIN